MRWKSEHLCIQIMNSPTLLALLIFSSASRASSFLDFSELDEENFQNEFFQNDVAYLSSFEDFNENIDFTTTDASQTDIPHFKDATEDQKKRKINIENSINLGGTFNYIKEHPAYTIPVLNEVTTDKRLLNYVTVYPDGHQGLDRVLETQETNPNQTPRRRDIKNWRRSNDYSDTNTASLVLDAYYPRTGPNTYLVDPVNLEDKDPIVPSVVLAEDTGDHNFQSKHPQYFQKNYYYNYYPLVNDRKLPQSKWSDDEKYGLDDTRRTDFAVVPKIPGQNPCRQYLEFLKYAFDKLDENSDYYANEDYPDWKDLSKNPQLFRTQLLGPMFYVDNSGKISQINTNGNSVQVAEGVSPDSRVSVFSKSISKPTDFFTITTPDHLKPEGAEQPKTTTITSPPHIEKSNQTLGNHQWPVNDKKNETESQTILADRRLVTAPTDLGEHTTMNEFDFDKSTQYQDEQYGRSANSNLRKPSGVRENTVETTTTTPSRWFTQTLLPAPVPALMENRVRAKTMLSFANAHETDIDCNDKILPCPDTVNITYPLNGYCNRYVTCESGRAIRRTCPDGLHFNIIIKSCDLPHNSICTYTCPESNGLYGIPGDCGGYFVCKNSVPEYRMCPPQMHWDTYRNTCTFAELSRCPMKCYNDNEVRHYEGDCKAYIVCLNGIPYYHKCPPRTQFDRKELLCVPERMSECEDNPRLLTKTLNPSTVCKDIQLKMNPNAWCRSFLPPNLKE